MGERLKGKVAVITGAASGIGAATAQLFVEEGARVVLADIQSDIGKTLAAALGPQNLFRQCDVTKESEIAALINQTVQECGRLDVMFNNAGIVGAVGPIDTTPAEEWSRTLDVLLSGVFYGMKHAASVMKKQGFGSIVSMSSVAGVYGGLGPHAYTAAKHAVVGLTKNVATELCRYGVRVNAIGPYSVATPMVSMAYLGRPDDVEGTLKMLSDESPLQGRAGTARDVANAALWLASDDSGYTTGHVLMVDAGVTIGAQVGPPRFAEYRPMLQEAGKVGL